MAKDDRLYHFVSRLQPWAHMEMKRREIEDLHMTYVVDDSLVELRGDGPQGLKPQLGSSSSTKSRFQKLAWLRKKVEPKRGGSDAKFTQKQDVTRAGNRPESHKP